MKSIYTVYHVESDTTLEATELKVVEDRAIVLVQDRICIARLINEVWTISSADGWVLDLCDII